VAGPVAVILASQVNGKYVWKRGFKKNIFNARATRPLLIEQLQEEIHLYVLNKKI
jgi:hypothetical protein